MIMISLVGEQPAPNLLPARNRASLLGVQLRSREGVIEDFGREPGNGEIEQCGE
jgi:hypothetical protein